MLESCVSCCHSAESARQHLDAHSPPHRLVAAVTGADWNLLGVCIMMADWKFSVDVSVQNGLTES